MKSNTWLWRSTCALTATIFLGGANANAQGSQPSQGGQNPPAAQQGDKSKTPEVTPLTLDVPPPVNAEEDAAFKAFQAVNPNDSQKKIESGEAFLSKYPESRYKSPVLGQLTYAYIQTGNTAKMQECGERELAIAPNDVSTLSIMAQSLPRSMRGNASDPANAQILAKAEEYSKRAIEITPTLPKPDGLSDEAFTSAKNQSLAMAHSGLGLVYIRRGKNAEAIPELEQSIKVDPNPDPVNYYLLGMADKVTSHFDDALAAFNKCASMNGPLQGTCKSQADNTKKQSTTQLSAPK
jgi:tetratricopeptide (TPR) repeat protein